MCRHADTANAPSVFIVSLVFGGGSGAAIAASVGLDGGVGFLVGASIVFLFLWATVLSRQAIVESEQVPLVRETDRDRSPQTSNSAGSAPS